MKYPEVLTAMENAHAGDRNPLYGVDGMNARAMRDIAALIHQMWRTINDLEQRIVELERNQ